MTQRTVQRFVAVAALACILFLTATSVQAREIGPAYAWQRLQDLWSKAVSVLGNCLDGRNSGDLVKEGPGVDPNGSPKPGSTAPAAGTPGDAGPAVDPNG